MASNKNQAKLSFFLKPKVNLPKLKGGTKNVMRRGPPGPAAKDDLNPRLPPDYPRAPKPSEMSSSATTAVGGYVANGKYFTCNFNLTQEVKHTGIPIERYVDQYKSPLTLQPYLVPMAEDDMFPEVLTVPQSGKMENVLPKKAKKVEDLSDFDKELEEGVKLVHIKQERLDEDEVKDVERDNTDEESQLSDEEMDCGTDYNQSYFDNGEDDEDDGKDDEAGF